MNTKRGPHKPAGEMTDAEAAEVLFGKRIIRKVDKELEAPKTAEDTEESEEDPSIEDQDR